MIKLSILICTMPERKAQFRELIYNLERQLREIEIVAPEAVGCVEVLHSSRMDVTVGMKRNLLLEMAKGEFVVFIDDDDTVSDAYIRLIIDAIDECPDADCVGIQGIYSIVTERQDAKQWYISRDYGRWYEDGGVYFRTPNHISPVRREIALQAGFPDKNFGEDFDYSAAILPFCKREIKIRKNIYHYRFNPDK